MTTFQLDASINRREMDVCEAVEAHMEALNKSALQELGIPANHLLRFRFYGLHPDVQVLVDRYCDHLEDTEPNQYFALRVHLTCYALASTGFLRMKLCRLNQRLQNLEGVRLNAMQQELVRTRNFIDSVLDMRRGS